MRPLLPILPVLLLGGCAHYFEPLGGPTANLRFVSLPGNKTEIHALSEARCDSAPSATIAVVGEALRNETGQGRSVGMPLSDPASRTNASEIAIRSGQAFAAQMKAAQGPGPSGVKWAYGKCSKRFVLNPKEGMNYEAQLEQYNGGCTLNVFRISREAGTYVRRLADTEVTRCR
ncbi:MAG: hypothetical protein HZA59_13650 [Hydrogenophilales bacterium]|nr:hypothetical protein [Hydrogenophilales bacterium]